MPKPQLYLLPDDIEDLRWEAPDGALAGVVQRVLARDPVDGSITRLLRVPPYVDTGIFRHDHWEEVLIVEGSYKMGPELHPTGTYTCKGPHVDHGPFLTNDGYVCLEFRDFHGPAMDKPKVTLLPLDIDRIPWAPILRSDGVTERVLTRGASGSLTRLLKAEPGSEITPGALAGTFETYLLDGSCRWGDELLPAGSYTSVAQGSEPDLVTTAEGFLRLEVINVA